MPTTLSRPHTARPTTLFSWQGWQLHLPARWGPMKLEGDYEKGLALFADLLRPRLGIRWEKKPRRRTLKVRDWLARVMRDEVGALAAAEATPFPMASDQWIGSTLYVEPKPPGRDVWVGFSSVSDRALALTYHARRREHALAETVLPTLRDLPATGPMPWSVFELNCTVPAGMRLQSHRLNAGDLTLSFLDKKRQVTVRQVAVAEIALQRQPLGKWLAQQQATLRKHYRPAGDVTPVTFDVQGREIAGLTRALKRRRRFFYMMLPNRLTTYALHDEARDRLVFVQGTDDNLAREIAQTVGARNVGAPPQ